MFQKLKRLFPDRLKVAAQDFLRDEILARLETNECIRCAVGFACWNQVPGDYLEFGCWSGKTFSYAYRLFQTGRAGVNYFLSPEDKPVFKQMKPRFFAFDSFEGLPEAKDIDSHPYTPMHWKKGTFATSEDAFKKAIRQRKVNLDDVCIVKGWYDKTLTDETKQKYNLTQASVVHIDCDYYESTILALDFITDLVDDGTVIVFDDYNCYRGSPYLGERRAFSEWLSKNPHIKVTELAKHNHDRVAFFLNIERSG